MSPSQLIESGLLELYVLGQASEKEIVLIEEMSSIYSDVHDEIERISITLENMAIQNAIEPDPTIKPFLMATLRYIARMEKGEAPSFPKPLTATSKIEDYETWINRSDLQLTESLNDFYAHIIAGNKEMTTAIVWIKHLAPTEVHGDEFERFLILEGSCDIVIEDKIHHLYPGDFMEIPLHKKHHVLITSDIPCKLILQRAAA